MPKGFRRILVAVRDPEHAPSAALRKAAALARPAGASVELFHAVNAPIATRAIRSGARRGNPAEARDEIAARTVQRLQRMARSAALRGLRVRVHAQWDYPPHEAIVRRAEASRADLVVAKSQPRSAAARFLLANTDWELIRHCPCPLLLVKGSGGYERAAVIASVDPFHAHDKPGHLDQRLIAAGQSVAALLRGELHVFHAYAPLVALVPTPGVQAAPVWVPPEAEEERRGQTRSAVDRLAERAGVPRARRHVAAGDVATQLAALVRRTRARIVVMGAVSRSGLKRLFLGNTAERVLDALPCDVLVVKPRGFRSDVPAQPATIAGAVPY